MFQTLSVHYTLDLRAFIRIVEPECFQTSLTYSDPSRVHLSCYMGRANTEVVLVRSVGLTISHVVVHTHGCCFGVTHVYE